MLIKQIKKLQKTEIKDKVDNGLKEFKKLGSKGNKEWFSELCFCILTANSKARTAITIQKELKAGGFLNKSEKEISNVIRNNKHRFHNNKSKYIVEARKFKDIKSRINSLDEVSAIEFIVENIKGLGYKESSHFLRNVGYENLAILDRHIINLMVENDLIERPKTLTKVKYLLIEVEFQVLAKKMNMSCAELDLYMWYLKAGAVLK
ncbi:MAG: N-glycosylase/DNA lyase [Nanoarchaeota archaeon]|nr:N-glycosylase/DNA lyase [Nanoarchaeota archaeon]